MCGPGMEVLELIDTYKKSDVLIVSALEIETDNKLDDWNLIYTGVGKINATLKLTEYLNDFQFSNPKIVINFGTAGSRKIPIHTLVDCTRFIQRDMNTVGLGFPRGITPFEQSSAYAMDFSHIANPIDKNYICGTGDNFVDNISTEMEEVEVFDMEAYALAKVCWRYKVDFISYKYITDNVDEQSSDDWEKNCSKGVDKFKEILMDYYN